MTSNKNRYPTKYKTRYSQEEVDISVDSNGNDNKYDDTELNNFIVDNRNKIIELCNNKQDETLMNLINNSMSNDRLSLCFPNLLSDYCITTIAKYCIDNDDLELFGIIVHHYCLTSNDVNDKIITFISEYNNPMVFLNILIENNAKIYPNIISDAISADRVKFISCLASINYDIQKAWNVYILLLKLILNYDRIKINLISVPMLRVLIDHKINISLNLPDLINSAIYKNKLDIVKFIVESFPEHNIDQYLNVCCESQNNDALLYFLKIGANVHDIITTSILHTSIDVIKILINHNYPVPLKPLKNVLRYHFTFDDDLKNINYLLPIGTEIRWIFDVDDREATRRVTYPYALKERIYSSLEYVITTDHIDKIKLLADNHLNELKPKLNGLFIIACANGRNDIATYLFDLGAELNENALTIACFFGHFETVIMLLKLGMTFNMTINSIKENLFTFTSAGYLTQNCSSEIYNNLVSDDIIFRNDIYNYGEGYLDIVKLLINYNVPIDNSWSWIFTRQSDIFYEVEIFRYFLQNGMNINKTTGHNSMTFLEVAINFKKLDVIEFLLQEGINKKITNERAIKIINDNEQIKHLLLTYGVDL